MFIDNSGEGIGSLHHIVNKVTEDVKHAKLKSALDKLEYAFRQSGDISNLIKVCILHFRLSSLSTIHESFENTRIERIKICSEILEMVFGSN